MDTSSLVWQPEIEKVTSVIIPGLFTWNFQKGQYVWGFDQKH